MKSTGDILKELGFRKDAPRETQKAFLKHLIQATSPKPIKSKDKNKTNLVDKESQLSFDLESISKISESA